MKARLFESVEQMLSKEGLASVLGSAVDSVERSAMPARSASASRLERVRARRGERSVCFVLKHYDPEHDWAMRATHDRQVREVALFRSGIYGRLPDVCIVPLVAAARVGESWASLMVDVLGALVVPSPTPLPAADVRRFLDHLAALHARFMEDESLQHPALGLCAPRDWLMMYSPPDGQRASESGNPMDMRRDLIRGWEEFERAAPPQAAAIIKRVRRDLRPLLRVLARAPRTLLHGDYQFAHIGPWAPLPASVPDAGSAAPAEPRTVITGWNLAGFGAPLLDLAWFLAVNSAMLPISKEDAIGVYREALASWGYPYQPHAWTRDLEASLLAGGALRLAWQMALGTQSDDPSVSEREMRDVQWWSGCVIGASRWLG